jgi:Flp pilus assembly protein TadD
MEEWETLWDNVIKNQPCSRAYSARATLFRRDANKLKNEADVDKNAKKEQEANLKYAEANKNYQQAIDYYTEAIKLNVIDHESYNNRANIYMDQNKFDNAIVDYRQALVVKPNYYVALDNIGALYARRGMLILLYIILPRCLKRNQITNRRIITGPLLS